MKKTLIAIVIALCFTFTTSGQADALDLSVGPFLDEMTDTTMRVTGFSRDSVSQIGTGLCYGTLFKVTNKDKHFADILSPCVLGSASYQGEAETDVLVGAKVFEIMVFNAGILYNATRNEPRDKWYDNFSYGLGMTLTGFGEAVTNKIKGE